ncbi:hypothetical protein [Calderihabitans maritimus]|uniref:O-antigen polymerase n=1 Tax=Calderihabitans maritimus TaxID=1246530 RepID=A0A1Z5HX12_9FIRM|nr:hypothetical protein [Calderihabitans maritimus]GAW94073.1 hypothetical protein KKC1_31910 [Calderihabitans maritimus]
MAKLFIFISFLLLFGLSLESIPLPITAQVSPLTSLLAVFFLPLAVTRLRVTPLLKAVILFVVYVLIHSVIALFIDVIILEAGELRVLAWARQMAALLAGLAVFLVLRKTLVRVSDRYTVGAVAAGALPALAMALLNVIWGLTGSALAGGIVTGIRTVLVPLGYTAPVRASGLSLEPSHFAFYLAIVVLPVTFVAFAVSRKSWWWLTFLACTLIAFVWTVSITGLMVMVGFLLAGVLVGPGRRLYAVTGIVLLVAVTGYAVLFPHNYAAGQVQSFLSEDWTISIVNRFYSTWGPVASALSSYTLLGYGLGGMSTHFSEVLPAVAQVDIAAVSWADMPTLKTLVGRVLAETGLVGLWLFSAIILTALQQVKNMRRHRSWRSKTPLLAAAGPALSAFLLMAAAGHGSFALPYFWFWLAVIDSRYLWKQAGAGPAGP